MWLNVFDDITSTNSSPVLWRNNCSTSCLSRKVNRKRMQSASVSSTTTLQVLQETERQTMQKTIIRQHSRDSYE